MVAVDLTACMVVSAPEWNEGDPVRVQAVHPMYGGRMAVRYQDARQRTPARAEVIAVGMELTLISGGCVGVRP